MPYKTNEMSGILTKNNAHKVWYCILVGFQLVVLRPFMFCGVHTICIQMTLLFIVPNNTESNQTLLSVRLPIFVIVHYTIVVYLKVCPTRHNISGKEQFALNMYALIFNYSCRSLTVPWKLLYFDSNFAKVCSQSSSNGPALHQIMDWH